MPEFPTKKDLSANPGGYGYTFFLQTTLKNHKYCKNNRIEIRATRPQTDKTYFFLLYYMASTQTRPT